MRRLLVLSLIATGSASSTGAVAAVGPCPAAEDPAGALKAIHEQSRRAHMEGNASLLAEHLAERMITASGGDLISGSGEQTRQFFAGYFNRVRYLEWADEQAPIVSVSPDGKMGWMAVKVRARYVEKAKPEAGERSFKSSWIATFDRIGCDWKMTGISSSLAG
jgi:hypothetical protein